MNSTQVKFSERERVSSVKLIGLALAGDLGDSGDLTSEALIDENRRSRVAVVTRESGVLAGIPVAKLTLEILDPKLTWHEHASDGASVDAGTVVAVVEGSLRSLLAGERSALNFLTHLSGVATLTRRFVDAVAGTGVGVGIFDTRKTLPGWRVLAKYAVRVGGGMNHRMGLYDGILIKDNHLAGWKATRPEASVADAVRYARQSVSATITVGVEVDTLEQLDDALTGHPDFILLDNMDSITLHEAVLRRNRLAPEVKLEASGGITLDTVAEIAKAGIDRMSVGVLTHSVAALDLAFDWHSDMD